MSAPIANPLRIGIIGCGNISAIYCKNLTKLAGVSLVALADLDRARAEARATEFAIARVLTPAEMLADAGVDLIVNLTIPAAHAPVCLDALRAGKHVYVEKPLAVTREDGQRIMALARERRLRVGCAPDTVLGAGIQTCRQLIDDGAIGTPVAATAFMLSPGHESWHPDPAFYYQAGGGPLFDMGPYYLSALITLLGPVKRVTGSAKISRTERTITSKPKQGQVMKVDVPTHIATVLDFHSGPVGLLTTSFDVHGSTVPRIEIYGTAGTLSVPDPNTFGGSVKLLKAGTRDWIEQPLRAGYDQNTRGLGIADLADALRAGTPHRANGDIALHVLDLMHAAHEASAQGTHIAVTTTCDRPALMPAGRVYDIAATAAG